jgi:hypothetical protein
MTTIKIEVIGKTVRVPASLSMSPVELHSYLFARVACGAPALASYQIAKGMPDNKRVTSALPMWQSRGCAKYAAGLNW